MKVVAMPELQETSDLPCDTGSGPEVLAREFEGRPVDLGFVREGWDSKRMKWAPTATAIEKRAGDARRWLIARPEKDIVVVSHGLHTSACIYNFFFHGYMLTQRRRIPPLLHRRLVR